MNNIEKAEKNKRRAKEWRTKNKEYYDKKTAEYREENRIVLAEKSRDYYNTHYRFIREEQRKKVINYYGGKCACCGETILEFLAIDHINGGGSAHRKSIKGRSIYKWLDDNNYPDGFQVLCHNCNMAKGMYGRCPHARV